MNNTIDNKIGRLCEEKEEYLYELIDFISGYGMPTDGNIDDCIDKLNTPIGISMIHNIMVNDPQKWRTYDIVKVKAFNTEFYEKILTLYKMTSDTIEYTKKKSKECYDSSKMYTDSEISSCTETIQKIENKINDKNTGLNALFEKENERESNIENKIKSNVYSEFITILGIFTAITFAIFGGMNLLSNLFQKIGSTFTSLGQTLILVAIFGLVMWGIIELLFYWISKIKGITDSTKDKNKKYFNWIAISVLTVILIIGILLFTK